MKMIIRLFVAGICFAVCTSARASLSLDRLFSDGVVLQRGVPIAVWGNAESGERVAVRLGDDKADAVAGKDGRWKVWLGPRATCAEPLELVVAGMSERLVVSDVVVGEVWLASGQSNMEWPLSRSGGYGEVLRGVINPLIREFRIGKTVEDAPSQKTPGAWTRATAESIKNFSGVGYFYAYELYNKLNVPIGIINASWSGTPIESWVPEKAYDMPGEMNGIRERYQDSVKSFIVAKKSYAETLKKWRQVAGEARRAGTKEPLRPTEPQLPEKKTMPSGLYNGMIHPVRQFAICGVIWYQGESNENQAQEYSMLFKALIAGWRESFGRMDMPFYWVQLPNYNAKKNAAGTEWAFLREAQSSALVLPGTGQAVVIDIGEPDNIHPANKAEVARRLALIALAKNYGVDCGSGGPEVSGVVFSGREAALTLTEAQGLHAEGENIGGFEIAGANRQFYRADARIMDTVDGKLIRLSSDDVAAPVAVRYAWRNNPGANLYNNMNLPLAPYRSDNWER